MARDVIFFIPLSPDQASLFWFCNSAAHIFLEQDMMRRMPVAPGC
jgi:hypothetical protein